MRRTISQVLENSLGSREVVPGLNFLYLGVTFYLASGIPQGNHEKSDVLGIRTC